MKRWTPPVIRMCVFLLLGAIVNIAVAWGLAQSGGIGRDRYSTVHDEKITEFHRSVWRRYAPSTFASFPSGVHFEWHHIGARGFDLEADALDPNGDREYWQYAVIHIAGWPAESLIGYRFSQKSWDDGAPWTDHSNGFLCLRTPPEGQPGVLWLPAVPMWPGLAINTLFYAAILWGLSAAPFALRRRRRIKRGLCPKCAYPVGESPVCTECGTALPKQKAQMQKAET